MQAQPGLVYAMCLSLEDSLQQAVLQTSRCPRHRSKQPFA